MKLLEEKTHHYEKIKQAIEYMDEHYSYQPSLDEVALHIGMSKYHFSRIFKSYVGVTPMQFLQATTLSYAKNTLLSSCSLLDASLELGLSSSSRLHDLFVNFEGVTPLEYKKMGESLHITYGFGFSPFGPTLIAQTSKGVCALEFYENSSEEVFDAFKASWAKATLKHDDIQAQELLDRIFINHEKMNLFVKGTNFQMNVWKAILNIKKGELSTYSDVATLLGKPKAVRAVASAIGSNHIGFLIPCHRVISKSAAMSGYKWGLERKRIVLAYEQKDV